MYPYPQPKGSPAAASCAKANMTMRSAPVIPAQKPADATRLSTAAADAILVVHAAFVLFVVAGLPGHMDRCRLGRAAFSPGSAARTSPPSPSWSPSRCWATLSAHDLGDALRAQSGETIQRWIHAWLFWRAPA